MTMSKTSTNAVWTQLSADLWRFIRLRVPDDHAADDLLQETFVRIHRHLDKLSATDRLAAWVYKIARNVIVDHYRKTSVQEVSLPDDAAQSEDFTSTLRARAGEWMDEMIGQLPPKYREAVQLAELEGLTQQQIADRLGLSLPGAKSRVQRGRAMLREVLDGCCHFQFDRRGNLVDCDPRPDRTVCRDCGDD